MIVAPVWISGRSWCRQASSVTVVPLWPTNPEIG
jgi:hypothetical protein